MSKLRDFGIIEAIKPIGGGWRYMQTAKDGSLQRIPSQGAAPTGRNLVEQVRQYRINEGIEMGDPDSDVAHYIAKVSPQNDAYKGKGVLLNQPRPEHHVPLIQRIREWLDGLGPKKPTLMTTGEATERAQICVNCPQNIRWRTACGECNQAVDYLSITVRNIASFPLDDALHGCRLHNLHLGCAVFIDPDYLPAKVAVAPINCWIPTHEDNRVSHPSPTKQPRAV